MLSLDFCIGLITARFELKMANTPGAQHTIDCVDKAAINCHTFTSVREHTLALFGQTENKLMLVGGSHLVATNFGSGIVDDFFVVVALIYRKCILSDYTECLLTQWCKVIHVQFFMCKNNYVLMIFLNFFFDFLCWKTRVYLCRICYHNHYFYTCQTRTGLALAPEKTRRESEGTVYRCFFDRRWTSI